MDGDERIRRTRTRKAEVRLTEEQRARLDDVTRNGAGAAKRILHAHILLLCDADHPLGRYSDERAAERLRVHEKTVARTRRRFAREGVDAALDRKPRLTPPVPAKLDGAGEAQLVAVCCSPPPAGRACWTMQLLADALVARRVVVSISAETVRTTLKKTSCGPGAPSGSASRSATCRGSSRRWRTCSTPTPRRRTPTRRW